MSPSESSADKIKVPAKGSPSVVPFKGAGRGEDPVHLVDRASALALRAALITNRPLLVRGEPGIGKTQLAHAASVLLDREFDRVTVNARTETNDLLWTVDHIERLARAQMARSQSDVDKLDFAGFVRPGPLWKALNPASARAQLVEDILPPPDEGEPAGARAERIAAAPLEAKDERGMVLLIDEIDKADSAIPNGLLEALGKGEFKVPRFGTVKRHTDVPAPLIIFTTNRERFLPDAFLRRCWVLELVMPEDVGTYLRARGEAHFREQKFSKEALSEGVWTKAANIIKAARSGRDKDAYRPGVAEYIELLRAVEAEAPAEREGRLDELAALVTHKQGR